MMMRTPTMTSNDTKATARLSTVARLPTVPGSGLLSRNLAPQLAFNVFHHRSNRLDCLAQPLGGYVEFLAPVTHFVMPLDVDTVFLGLVGSLQIVRHA